MKSVIPFSDLYDVGEVVHISHLLTRAPDNERQEMELDLVSSKEMECFHKIQPNMSSAVRRNPWMFDPFKVGYVYQIRMIGFCLSCDYHK